VSRNKATADRNYQQILIESGFEADLGSTPEKFRHVLEDQVARWRPIVSVIGLKID